MRAELLPHPESESLGVIVTAEAERYGTELLLRFDVAGEVGRILLPPAPAQPSRRDELWLHTCFEAFVRPSRSPAYHELNLAPSGDWAFYHLDDYRAGRSSPELVPPAIDFAASADRLRLRASLDLATLLSPAVPWDLALCVVLEDTSGTRNFWALAHPPGEPDFHHPDCFVIHLPPPAAA